MSVEVLKACEGRFLVLQQQFKRDYASVNDLQALIISRRASTQQMYHLMDEVDAHGDAGRTLHRRIVDFLEENLRFDLMLQVRLRSSSMHVQTSSRKKVDHR